MLPYYFLGSFLISVFFLQWSIQPSYRWWYFFLLLILSFLDCFNCFRRPHIRYITTASCLGIACALLTVSYAADRGQFPAITPFLNLKTIVVEGVVIGQPDDRVDRLQVVVEVQQLAATSTGVLAAATGRIFVVDRRHTVKLLPGDSIRAIGKLSTAEQGTPYARYLTMRDIGGTLDARFITVTGTSTEERFTRILWSFNRAFHNAIGRVLPDPASGLLDGLLTGANSALSERLAADFRTTGLSHIVAVSGSNITVILSLLGSLLFFLPLKWRLLPCAAGIIVFVLFVGASASVVRAAITGIIGLLALQSGRLNDARLATLWTAFFMLMWNPWQLWADVGFQLSFLAVAGLIELSPLIEPLTSKFPSAGGMREALTATLCAQCTAVAWGAYSFGALPLISPLANILVAPLIPLAMLTGFIAVLVGWVMPPLGILAAFPAYILLESIILLAQLCARIPYASVSVNVSALILIAWYLLLVGAVLWIRKRRANDPPLPID